jgi:hypothetical protein
MIQPSLFERTTTGRTEREKRKSSSFFVIPFAEGVAPVAARQTYLRLRCGEELLRNRKHYADCQKLTTLLFAYQPNTLQLCCSSPHLNLRSALACCGPSTHWNIFGFKMMVKDEITSNLVTFGHHFENHH